MGLRDYGSFNEIVTKIVQGENIENAIPRNKITYNGIT